MAVISLVGNEESFFSRYWNVKPGVFGFESELLTIISSAEVLQLIGCSSLTYPHFTVLKDGVRQPLNEITMRRRVASNNIAGYPNPEGIMKHYEEGATIKLNQPEYWHTKIRRLLNDINDSFCAKLESSVFLTPSQARAMRPNTDEAHTLVLQLEGRNRWSVYDPGAVMHSGSVIEDVSSMERREILLAPGSLLYVPQGWPHSATAEQGPSLNLAITVREPTTADITETIFHGMREYMETTELADKHHVESSVSNAASVIGLAKKWISDREVEAIASEAVEASRRTFAVPECI